MRKMKIGILLVLAVLALVSVASAALPSQVTATISNPGPASYWNVDVVSTVGGSDILTTPDYAGWCGSSLNSLSSGSHVFKVYSSLGALPAGLPYANWNKINYVINHNTVGANKYTLQAVYWYYDGGPYPWGTVEGTPTTGKMGALIADADANGGTYVPSVPGELYAVILWSSRTAQPVFIELPIPDIPVPEFPSLALPIAMMIGVVGAVQYVRARKE